MLVTFKSAHAAQEAWVASWNVGRALDNNERRKQWWKQSKKQHGELVVAWRALSTYELMTSTQATAPVAGSSSSTDEIDMPLIASA